MLTMITKVEGQRWPRRSNFHEYPNPIEVVPAVTHISVGYHFVEYAGYCYRRSFISADQYEPVIDKVASQIRDKWKKKDEVPYPVRSYDGNCFPFISSFFPQQR